MIDSNVLLSELAYQNFSSYLFSNIILDFSSQIREESDPNIIYEKMVKSVRDSISNSSFRFPCFFEFQKYLIRKSSKGILESNVTIYLIINTDVEKVQKYSQWCWMTEEELKEHIDQVKVLFSGFEVHIQRKDDFICLTLELKQGEINNLQVRFLLNWIRYSYEFCASMAMRDAYLIKKSICPDISIFNLMQATMKAFYEFMLTEQVICHDGLFIPDSLLKERLEMGNTDYDLSLDSLYSGRRLVTSEPIVDHVYWRDITMCVDNSTVTKRMVHSAQWWLDEECFIAVRLPIHLENIKLLTNNYKQVYESDKKD